MNRLNKTREEMNIDFEAEKQARLAAEKRQRRDEEARRKATEDQERRKRQDEAETKSYGSVFKHANMSSNKREGPLNPKKLEEDFF